MTKVQIKLDIDNRILLPLPIEIRRLDLALVGRGVSTQAFDLNEGSYFVTFTFPDGQRLFGHAMVTGEETTILFSVDSDFDQSSALGVAPYERDYEVDSSLIIREFRGNIISEEIDYESRPFSAPLSLYVRGSNSTSIVQVLRNGTAPLNILIPAYPYDGCVVFIHPTREGHPRVEIRLADSSADLLLRYVTNGYLREAATLVHSKHFTIDDTVLEQASLLINLYTLLRIGELHKLARLINDSGHWSHAALRSPDSSVIRGEVLARLGRHHEAFEAFMELGSRGVPVFADGAYYATQRLNIYDRQLETSSFRKDISAYAILSKLRRIATYQAAANYPVVAYMGFNITAPDAVPFSVEMSESAEEAGGLRQIGSVTERSQEISGHVEYVPQDFSQLAINRGQRMINYRLNAVDQKLVEALKALKDALTNLPDFAKIDFDPVEKAISEAIKAGEKVTLTPPGVEISDDEDIP